MHVKTKLVELTASSEGIMLDSGERLANVTVAYETYGCLNKTCSNAILIPHALTGDAHAAGFHKGDTRPGWWDSMIGAGKAFDTNKYFVICSNVLGGCLGTTGPRSINDATGEPYGLDFPLVTIGDMVRVQQLLVKKLGIDVLLSVAGGSMGGMQVLEWVASYPQMVRSAIPIATTMKHTPQQIAFNEVGRQAIMADPHWNDGNYYKSTPPDRGLSVARMVGHITYMSDSSMAKKFGREYRDRTQLQRKFAADFEVEGYLKYRGESFVKRFDANTYLYITKAMDYFDAAHGKKPGEIFRGIATRFMVIAFTSDWLYPPYQSKDIVRACKLAGLDVAYCDIESSYGHDAFLLETERESRLISHFLARITHEVDADE